MEIIVYFCSVNLFYLPLILGSSIRIGLEGSYSNLSEQSILPCKKEELQCGNGLCLLNWLHCQYRKDCGREYTSVKLLCSKIQSNQSGSHSGYSHYMDVSNDSSLLVSPLVVAGIVIGLVLFLSCMTIIVGSFRKDSRLRNSNLRTEPSYAPDGFSFGGSVGELQSTCVEEYPPTFDIDSYIETLSQINVMYQDSPPHYEDCVGHRAPDLYLPEEDPPPYSLTDPRQRNVSTHREPPEDQARSQEPGDPPHVPSLPSESQQVVVSISSSSVPLDQAPPYEQVVFNRQEVALPLSPPGELKDTPEECRPISRTIV
ncbi:protein BEAN1 isoform X2 [Stegostoma tigrinum]|uniref:protein BEAN1 isoform X2 n=1 Tax=Stegostoma tigrinum TaxID=3053191 RepID=UPI00202B8FE5|nr:protein BEAN1 isoform X2 [Stegostoma tigrinum]